MCSDEDFKTALLQIHSQEKSKENSCNNKNEDNTIILEELKECENQLKNIKQICIEQHECLQRLLLQVANHKMINEVQHKQFICPMCELRISNSTYEEFEQHVVDHFEQKIMV